MLIKIHKTYRDIVAIADKELIGKYFEQDKFQLNIKESFYKGDEIPKEKLIPLIQSLAKEDATFNIVGGKSIQTALKAGIIKEQGIKKIAGIPFALVLG